LLAWGFDIRPTKNHKIRTTYCTYKHSTNSDKKN